MPTATLVPTALTDTNLNVATGAYTDVDETIASADGSTINSVTDEWTGGSGTGSAFSFTMSDLPAAADSINTVQFRVRAKVSGGYSNDDVTWRCDVSGTNAPTTKAQWVAEDDGAGFENRGASTPVTSAASVADVNGWTVRVYQSVFLELTPVDGLYLQIDAVEIIVDYNEAAPEPPGSGPTGGGYTVLPTTDTAIYGNCVARVRDFVVLGGLDTDRYSIRWSDINDPTSWSTPNTDAARAAQAGNQTFPTKYGEVTAIAGNDFYGYVFQERAISKMVYVGGDIVFSFDIFDEDRGCVRQGRMIRIDDKVFFQSNRGYHVLENDQIADIGFGIVDDSFN